ncbi:hypothetical protein CCACVL1_21348 [Corchorus capsularis]|uniref:Uncharacterized protein n=1 Tax=Corchorus capsularis TaxID=210143 RepID=A0A1R3H6B6_COCAP|nr:hypothetical protein CCACVL1_21348 [Corchorus capsularis]
MADSYIWALTANGKFSTRYKGSSS